MRLSFKVVVVKNSALLTASVKNLKKELMFVLRALASAFASNMKKF